MVMRILITILLALVGGIAYGENTIVGAFGQTLGAVFQPASRAPDEILSGGGHCYNFDPNKPDPTFDRYRFCISPGKGEIYAISARGLFDSEYDEECMLQMGVIRFVLKEKYPNLHYDWKYGRMSFSPNDGGREIEIQCIRRVIASSDRSGFDLTLIYSDREIAEQIPQEVLEEKASKLDYSNY